MSTAHVTDRRRRARFPLLTFLVAAAIVAGFAIGVQSLRSTTTAGAVAATPAPSTGRTIVNDGAKLVTRADPTPVVPAQACLAMDATAYTMYCRSVQRVHITAPRATWQACEAMDATTYRHLCARGDGGRWIEGS